MLIILGVIQYACRMFYGWNWHTTTFLPALTYVMTGFFLAKNRDRIIHFTNKRLLAAIIVGEMISLINLLHPQYDLSQSGIVLASVAMFIYAINNENLVISRMLEMVGHRYSLNIYIFHIMVNLIFGKVIKMLGINSSMVATIRPLLIVLNTLILAIILEKIYNRCKSY